MGKYGIGISLLCAIPVNMNIESCDAIFILFITYFITSTTLSRGEIEANRFKLKEEIKVSNETK